MKAACFLVGLALVHGITASIFNPLPLENLLTKTSDYLKQYHHNDQHSVSLSQQKPHTSSSEESEHTMSYRAGHNTVDPRRQSQEWYYQKPRDINQSWDNSKDQSSQENSKPWNPSTQGHHASWNSRKNYTRSSSSESHETWEKPWSRHRTSPPHNRQVWNTIDATVVTYDNVDRGYGDLIMWNNRLPVTPFHVTYKEEFDRIFADAKNTLHHILPEKWTTFRQALRTAEQKNTEDIWLNATQLLKKYKYPVEEHVVVTDDGYLLTLVRIPPTKPLRDVQQRPVVFLMHGLLGSADDWLLMGPGKSLAYILADEGYDVWMGNARGNRYSLRHVNKHPAMTDFWQFGGEEIIYDLSAMIDYTLQTTNQKKLFYVGHSYGTTTFFALAASSPEYNDKIIMMYALAPVVYMANVRSPLFRVIAPSSPFSEPIQAQIGYGDFNPNKELIRVLGGAMCEEETGLKDVCSNMYFVMAGLNIQNLDPELIPVIMSHLPAGTSSKLIKHYGQAVDSTHFQKYDYGAMINEQIYGSVRPPKYDVTKVTAPVTLYYSEEDWLAHPKDVERLQQELPNVVEAVKVPDEHFNHFDYQFSTKAPEIVYKGLVESIEKHCR